MLILLSTIDIVFRTLPQYRTDSNNMTAWNIIEYLSISWFNTEIIVRFIVCPNKLKFIMNPLNIIDITSIIPFYVYLGLKDNSLMIKIKNISRMLRTISAVLKTFNYFESLKTLSNTLRSSSREIFVYLVYLSLAILVFSSFVFYAEVDETDSKYYSIPAAFWYIYVFYIYID